MDPPISDFYRKGSAAVKKIANRRRRARSGSLESISEMLESRLLFSIGPLTTTTQSVIQSGLTATVQYSVFDPVRNVVKSGSSGPYTGATLAGWGVTGLISANGIVAWR